MKTAATGKKASGRARMLEWLKCCFKNWEARVQILTLPEKLAGSHFGSIILTSRSGLL